MLEVETLNEVWTLDFSVRGEKKKKEIIRTEVS